MKNKSIKITKILKNKTKNKTKKKLIYNKKDYYSGDGMLTSIWGPAIWHYLHVISFNYPVTPTNLQKKNIKIFY